MPIKMIITELLSNLYSNISPYSACEERYVDHGYPHTYIPPTLVQILFATIRPEYIVECGSMLGGSAMRMAQVLQDSAMDAEIVCIDSFTGDVNMWDWERNPGWKFLRLENGIPTIYKRFLANCKYGGFESKILPIAATTSVGVKLLQRLRDQGRISALPNYFYVDSAHEKDETFVELSVCWGALESGVLFGDDWGWDAVRNDVLKFADAVKEDIDAAMLHKMHVLVSGSSMIGDSILLYEGQWVIFKRAKTADDTLDEAVGIIAAISDPLDGDAVGVASKACGLYPYLDWQLWAYPVELYDSCGKGIGLWQYPNQFGPYLSHVVREMGVVQTYAEVGVAAGGTFMFTTEFLRKFCGLQKAYAVDIAPIGTVDYLQSSVSPFDGVLETYMKGIGAGVSEFLHGDCVKLLGELQTRGEKLDLLLIDGDHSYAGAKRDFEVLRGVTRTIVFHDIDNDLCTDLRQLWAELRELPEYVPVEFVAQYPSLGRRYLGIGVLMQK